MQHRGADTAFMAQMPFRYSPDLLLLLQHQLQHMLAEATARDTLAQLRQLTYCDSRCCYTQ